MPSRAFAITADDKPITVASSSAEVSITVANTAGKPIRGQVRLVALGNTKAEWLSIDREVERDFAAGGTHQFVVRLSVPAGVPPGKYSFRLNTASVQNPDDEYAEGPVIAFVVDPPPPAPAPAKKSSWLFWLLLALIAVGGGIGLYLALRPKPTPPNLHLVPRPELATTSPLKNVLLKPKYTVVLTDAGKSPIAVIKELRTATGLGLKEAKDLVEKAPATIKVDLPRADAEALKATLEAAGAKVELR